MYTAKGTLNRDAQLRQYTPLVRRLAHHMIAKLPPSVELDDLIQVGMIGLTEAIARYEPSQGVQFETFASQRIRGAMIDELRDGDWMSRGSRKSQKDIEQAVNRLQQKLKRPPRALGNSGWLATRGGCRTHAVRTARVFLLSGVHRSLRPLPMTRTCAPLPRCRSSCRRLVSSDKRNPVCTASRISA